METLWSTDLIPGVVLAQVGLVPGREPMTSPLLATWLNGLEPGLGGREPGVAVAQDPKACCPTIGLGLSVSGFGGVHLPGKGAT